MVCVCLCATNVHLLPRIISFVFCLPFEYIFSRLILWSFSAQLRKNSGIYGLICYQIADRKKKKQQLPP